MPGNRGAAPPLEAIAAFARSRAIRFSRSSSLTERPTRAGVKSLERRAPRVVGRAIAIAKYRCFGGTRHAGGHLRHPGNDSRILQELKYRFRAVSERTVKSFQYGFPSHAKALILVAFAQAIDSRFGTGPQARAHPRRL